MGCYFCGLKKKEIATVVAGGWGVTKYLQLDWMDDGMDGWMEKASQKTTTTSFTICNISLKTLCIFW